MIEYIEKLGEQLQCLTEGKERNFDFGLSYQEVQKMKVSRNQDSTVVVLILTYCIL